LAARSLRRSLARSANKVGQSFFYSLRAASKRLAFACRVQVRLSATFSRQVQFGLRVGSFRPLGWVGYSCRVSHAWGRPTAFSAVVFCRFLVGAVLKKGGHLTSHSSGQRDVPKSLAFAALILCRTFRAATLPLNASVMCGYQKMKALEGVSVGKLAFTPCRSR